MGAHHRGRRHESRMRQMIPACLPPRDVSRPKVPPPPDACDTHAHVFGPAERFRYADDRSYTPPDAPLGKYLDMLDSIGFARGVLVQGSAHGRDNSAMLDALAHRPDRLRGVAVADADISPADLREWNRLGVRGLRFNHFFRDGQLHYRGGVPLSAAERLAPVMVELGWHLQLSTASQTESRINNVRQQQACILRQVSGARDLCRDPAGATRC